ncbi:hypothetical protein PCC9214_02434 [Planktothrix tepida]|uniref:Nephrocystin 3-like N-terminal domain-containing protein n=1 Tax=Planktothrix tepida PCC 9214 TaxID=671072 RepID=A0A1J1LIQ6_9CYAN|nr:hypothetical protein [Planktothrix tepida]CAD5949077.1 hypothetical protein PCC9214_02434 [Planktothrix tepida]CUR32477.1 conserved hypothetical protein [Planktothrix tepida PCC 9214]
MEWETFIKNIAIKQGLSIKERETLLQYFPSEEQRSDQASVAKYLQYGVEAIKQRMQSIYEKFDNIFPELKEIKGAGKSNKLHQYLRQQFYQQNDPPIPHPPQKLTTGFESLIEEKVKNFHGREFVFDEFQQFLTQKERGYFVIIGEPGMGKSAIAAKYTIDYQTIHYFNDMSSGRTSPELFLTEFRQQLIQRFNLKDAEQFDLPKLLETVNNNDLKDEKLVLVVDALDEVQQEGAGNLLYLPYTLPKNVYFLMTRRPYSQEEKRFSVAPGLEQILDLREEKYKMLTKNDIRGYIRCFITHDPEHCQNLQDWISKAGMTQEEFIEVLTEKSDYNFMYLRFVLPDISKGYYPNLRINELPKGLEEYYYKHWQRLGMDQPRNRLKAVVLAMLSVINKPVSAEAIANCTQNQTVYDVENVLKSKDWMGFLRSYPYKGEICYTLYHKSFADFLSKQTVIKREANQLLDRYTDGFWDDNEGEDNNNEEE